MLNSLTPTTYNRQRRITEDDFEDNDNNEEEIEDDIFSYDLQTKKMCYYCGIVYQEINNIGTLRCTYHPGEILKYDDKEKGRSRFTYSCCSLPYQDYSYEYNNKFAKYHGVVKNIRGIHLDNLRGCCSCDHTVVPKKYTESDDITLEYLREYKKPLNRNLGDTELFEQQHTHIRNLAKKINNLLDFKVHYKIRRVNFARAQKIFTDKQPNLEIKLANSDCISIESQFQDILKKLGEDTGVPYENVIQLIIDEN